MTAEEPILVSDGPTDPEYESEEIIERDFTEDPEEEEEEDEEEKRHREKDRKLREVVKLLDQLKVLLVKVLEE